MTRVLLIEDHELTRRSLQALLVRRGCEVTAVADAPDGIAALDQPFDAVVCDLMLPRGSGVDVLRVVRERHLQATLIVTTGATDPDLLMRVAVLQPDALVKKTMPIEVLMKALGV